MLPRVVSITSHLTNLHYAPRSQLCSILCISLCIWLTIPSSSVTLFKLFFFPLFFCSLKTQTHEPIKLENFSTGHATNNKRAQIEKDHIKRGPMENLARSSLPQITNGPQHKYIKLAKRIYMDSPTK